MNIYYSRNIGNIFEVIMPLRKKDDIFICAYFNFSKNEEKIVYTNFEWEASDSFINHYLDPTLERRLKVVDDEFLQKYGRDLIQFCFAKFYVS